MIAAVTVHQNGQQETKLGIVHNCTSLAEEAFDSLPGEPCRERANGLTILRPDPRRRRHLRRSWIPTQARTTRWTGKEIGASHESAREDRRKDGSSDLSSNSMISKSCSQALGRERMGSMPHRTARTVAVQERSGPWRARIGIVTDGRSR